MLPSSKVSTRRSPARLIAAGAIALAAGLALAAPAVIAAEQEPGRGFAADSSAPPAAYASADLRQLLISTPALVIAGERLNTGLLRRFYARRDFEPVWPTRQEQAHALVGAVLHAGDHGLAPQLFHANMLLSRSLPPLYRELLLSDAFLSYADALARGAMPVERRRDDEALTHEPVDVAAALDAAIDSPDPAASIAALAPKTPTYRLLRQALHDFHDGAPVGGKTSTARLREIEVNLERERWLPRPLPPDRVWVNVADQKVVLYRDDRPVFSTRVIIGQSARHNQSPEFQTNIDGILFNPPWNVPLDIAKNEILPKARSDPDYLARHRMVMLPDGGVEQLAGPHSALGALMFEMGNRFDVYLHDTPSKAAFGRDDRRISHGCIRVEKPRELAALLMQEPIEAIDREIATGDTHRSELPQPVPVFVSYETAFANAEGRLEFRPDIYGRDAEIWTRLDPERRPIAERASPSDRRG